MTERGKLIVIEGLDGAGTTTQVRLVENWLSSREEIDFHSTREPSRGPIGALLRAILVKRLSADSLTIAGLYAADRMDHVTRAGGINELLKQGKWVLMDRYYLSSFAYQASSMNETQLEWLRTIHQFCPPPDLTVFVDVPVDECLRRIQQNRHAEFELFDEYETLKRTLAQYQKAISYFSEKGETFAIIDGTTAIEEVSQKIIEAISTHFSLV